MEEIWKDIKGYEGKYQVSNLGNIKSLNYKNTGVEKVMGKYPQRRGYLRTTLCKNAIKNFYSIHRIVAQTFILNPNNLPEVNHKDGNKKNNCINNLEWVTRLENVKHSIVNKLRINKYGKDNLNSKIIYQIDIKTNEILNIFYGSGDIKRKTNYTDTSSILKCCRNVKNYKTAYGYKWRYGKGGDRNE